MAERGSKPEVRVLRTQKALHEPDLEPGSYGAGAAWVGQISIGGSSPSWAAPVQGSATGPFHAILCSAPATVVKNASELAGPWTTAGTMNAI